MISEEDYVGFKTVFDEDKQNRLQKKETIAKELIAYEEKLRTHTNISSALEKYKHIDTLTHEIINDFVDSVLIGEKNSTTGKQKIIINWLL